MSVAKAQGNIIIPRRPEAEERYESTGLYIYVADTDQRGTGTQIYTHIRAEPA
jgi:hypothetical protein